jgi:hypothetical protein
MLNQASFFQRFAFTSAIGTWIMPSALSPASKRLESSTRRTADLSLKDESIVAQ